MPRRAFRLLEPTRSGLIHPQGLLESLGCQPELQLGCLVPVQGWPVPSSSLPEPPRPH